jgi:hypothetical protein
MKKNLATTVTAKVTASVKEASDTNLLSTMIANSVSDSVEKFTPVTDAATGDKIQYYLERACQELSNNIQDINFEMGNALSGESSEITNITTDDSDTTRVTFTKQYKVKQPRDIQALIAKAKNAIAAIRISNKFSKYITFTVAVVDDAIVITAVLLLPSTYVESIGGADFLKRNSVVTKEIRKIVEGNLN